MEDVMFASSEADSRAVEAVEQHHAVLAGALSTQVEQLLSAGEVWQPVRDGLVAWCRSDLVPHAQAEEGTLYPPGDCSLRGAEARGGAASSAGWWPALLTSVEHGV